MLPKKFKLEGKNKSQLEARLRIEKSNAKTSNNLESFGRGEELKIASMTQNQASQSRKLRRPRLVSNGTKLKARQ